MGAWVIGHNLAGYLPESDTYAFEDWQSACVTLKDEMREYAERDDEAARDSLPDTKDEAEKWGYTVTGSGDEMVIDYGDDAPSMEAEAAAILQDDGPDSSEGKDWSTGITDHRGRVISFWLMWSDDRSTDDADS